MLDLIHRLPTSSLSAAADGKASPFPAFGFDCSPTPTDPGVEITGDIRRLSAALESRFIALVLGDEHPTRTGFLTHLADSLPVDEYRVLPVCVPRRATRKQMMSLLGASAGLVEPAGMDKLGRGKKTRAPLLSAYDAGRRFESDVVKAYAGGRRTLLMFDDAHLLTPAGLHLIHWLSNITAGYDLAVAIVLAAETSFAARLRRPAWRALASRSGAVVRLSRERM